MKIHTVAVPVAGLAAVLTRWPDLASGIAATLLAGFWTLFALRAHAAGARPWLHVAGPAAAILMLVVPVAADPLVPLPGFVVGILAGFALLSALPERPAGLDARRGLAAWSPVLFVGGLMLLPALALSVVGPDRLSAAVDSLGPAGLTLAVLLVALVVAGTTLLTHKEATA